MEVPAGLPVVSQTDGGLGGWKCDSWSHFGDGGLMRKRHFRRPNLLIINQRVWGFWGWGRGHPAPPKRITGFTGAT